MFARRIAPESEARWPALPMCSGLAAGTVCAAGSNDQREDAIEDPARHARRRDGRRRRRRAAGHRPADAGCEDADAHELQAKDAERSIDAPPRGHSMGDRFLFASTLRYGAQLAGRMEGDCVAIDLKFEGMQCTLTAVLADGSITLQGASLSKHIPGRHGPERGRLRDHRRHRRVRRRGGHDAPQRQRQDGHGRVRAAVRPSRGRRVVACGAARRARQTYDAPLPSGSISAALAACGISGWPHFQQ